MGYFFFRKSIKIACFLNLNHWCTFLHHHKFLDCYLELSRAMLSLQGHPKVLWVKTWFIIQQKLIECRNPKLEPIKHGHNNQIKGDIIGVIGFWFFMLHKSWDPTIMENKRYHVCNIAKITCSKGPFENIHENVPRK